MKIINRPDQVSPLKELLIDELGKLLHAEGQLLDALPTMADAAHHSDLKDAFREQLKQTQSHVDRLTSALELLREKADPKPCKSMLSLIVEGNEAIEDGKQKLEPVADLALIAVARKIELYQISGYTSARSLARQINESQVASLLGETLKEEESAEALLAQLAAPMMYDSSTPEAEVKHRVQNA